MKTVDWLKYRRKEYILSNNLHVIFKDILNKTTNQTNVHMDREFNLKTFKMGFPKKKLHQYIAKFMKKYDKDSLRLMIYSYISIIILNSFNLFNLSLTDYLIGWNIFNLGVLFFYYYFYSKRVKNKAINRNKIKNYKELKNRNKFSTQKTKIFEYEFSKNPLKNEDLTEIREELPLVYLNEKYHYEEILISILTIENFMVNHPKDTLSQFLHKKLDDLEIYSDKSNKTYVNWLGEFNQDLDYIKENSSYGYLENIKSEYNIHQKYEPKFKDNQTANYVEDGFFNENTSLRKKLISLNLNVYNKFSQIFLKYLITKNEIGLSIFFKNQLFLEILSNLCQTKESVDKKLNEKNLLQVEKEVGLMTDIERNMQNLISDLNSEMTLDETKKRYLTKEQTKEMELKQEYQSKIALLKEVIPK